MEVDKIVDQATSAGISKDLRAQDLSFKSIMKICELCGPLDTS
jgi:hypothetical protein